MAQWEKDPVISNRAGSGNVAASPSSPTWASDPIVGDGQKQQQQSASFREGAAVTQNPVGNIVAGLMNAGQGAAFNFGDELAGLAAGYGALRQRLNPFTDVSPSITDAYKNARDFVRGAVDQYRQENPTASIAGQLFGGLALGGGLGRAFGTGTTVVGNILRGAAAGGAEGALRGAGQSTSMADIGNQMLSEGGMGAFGGGAASAASQGIGAVARAVAPRVPSAMQALGNVIPGLSAGIQANDDAIADIARRRVAEALLRDQRTPQQVQTRLNTLGPEARIADAGGASTRQLLDTQATLPGQTAQQVEQAIRQRQAGRAGRLVEAASDSLNVGGKRLASTLDALDLERKAQAGPLYDVVRNTTVQVDDELRGLLERSKSALGPAKKIAEITGEAFEVPNGQTAPLKTLDQIKRALYVLEEKNINPETGRVNEIGRAYQNLRRTLVDKLDNLTADPNTGQSFYKAARDAYAGPTELRVAAQQGFKSMSQDATTFAETVRGLSASEKDAFRIGAMEALRNKFGTLSGQSSVLRLWREPAMQEKLKQLFPDVRSYRDFAVTVGAEERLRQLESVGRGSQTARRLAAAEDQGERIASDLQSIAAGGSGTPSGVATMLKAARDLYSRLDTPERVRNEIGRILLLQNGQVRTTQNEIRKLADVLERYNTGRTAASVAAGATGGVAATQE